MGELPSGTITFVLTDIVGSTALWEADPATMLRAMTRHHDLVAGAAERNRGALVRSQGEGDSSFTAFGSAVDAAAFARDLLWAFAAEQWPTGSPLVLRVGINTGTAENHGGDYYGRAVNRCARIRAVAHAGQVLVSATSALLIEQAPPQGTRVQRLGRLRLRDLVEPEEVSQLSIDGLPSEFPPPRSLESVPNNLPLYLTSFIGREDELARARGSLTEQRLVTFTGVGGTGKTRLSVQVAAEMIDECPGGVWILELASIADPTSIEPALAGALGLEPERGRSIRESIRERFDAAPSLLVLDNCEHLVADAAAFAAELLSSTKDLRILATTREALGIPGEVLLPIPPLDVPAADASYEELVRHDAVTLFADRARAINPAFSLTERNAAAVATVCARLDGIPLAIELAAARANVLSADQIAKRLDDRFALLTRGARDAEPRQQTLRAVIDWSYDLLPVAERDLFAALAVFPGSFSLEAAEAIVASGERSGGVLEGLSRLVERSLVVTETVDERARYRMLETVRDYAARRLVEAGRTDALRSAHLGWCLRLTEATRTGLTGPDRVEWLRRGDRELDNVRAAFEWAIAGARHDDAAALIVALRTYWVTRGPTEGRTKLERVAPSLAEPSRRRDVLATLGALAQAQGDLAAARAFKEDALAVARSIGDPRVVASSLHDLGHLHTEQGEVEPARARYEEALAMYRSVDDVSHQATLLYNLGNVARMRRELDEAERLYGEALERARGMGDRDIESAALFALGAIAVNRRAYDDASRSYAAALDIARSLGADPDVATILTALGGVQIEQGDRSAARASLEEGRAIHEALGYRVAAAVVELHLAEIARTEEDQAGARAHLERGMAVITASGARRPMGYAFEILADVERADGNPAAAWRAIHDGMTLRLEMRDAQGIATLLERAAGLLAIEGSSEAGAEALGAADAVRARIGAPVPPSARARYDADRELLRDALGATAFDEAASRGAAMSLDDAATILPAPRDR